MRPRELAAADIADRNTFLREVVEPCRPVVIRQLTRHWPAVLAAQQSPRAFQDYVSQFDTGTEAEIFIGEPRITGKYYYSDDLQSFNFERRRMRFTDALDRIIATLDRKLEPSMYVGSLPMADYLPGFSGHNALPMLNADIVPRLWLGHASVVSAHYDTLDNIACVIAGARRFKLFAPEAIANLYVGPIDFTMAGQPVSLAASAPPEDERYPRFREVRDLALVAELQPGDAIYIPKLWWHQVEALSQFNALVNYWWDAFSTGPDAPSTSLLLSMLTISERPPAERRAWQAFFDHYVFRSRGHPLAHLPPDQHGVLGPLKPHNYGRIRARVMQLLRGG